MTNRACYSDRGKQREHNEDACALPGNGADEVGLGTLLALADGTGGLPGGGAASQAAVNYLQAFYYAAAGPDHPADRLRSAFEAVNALSRLAQRQLGLEQGYLTTLVAAVILSDQVWVANVGDSRAYLIQAADRQIQQLTEDHSGHVRNVKAGLVQDDNPTSRHSGIITRAIGLQDSCQVDTYHYTWAPGDRLVLCSDGLAGLAADDFVAIVLEKPPASAAMELVGRAVQLDGSDNCTAVVAACQPPNFPMAASPAATHPDTMPSRPLTAGSPSATPQPEPEPPGGKRPRNKKPYNSRLPASPVMFWLIVLGLILGWISAGLLLFILLQSSGRLSLF